ncbi:hypothetical protein Spla01_06315 [Streptomyces platensis]|uniref:Uncharacterized protein n=1 Tax=Streptomyces platensis TaxID=58346 RepID=A0ABX3Y420_STRPT|nr:hypothetical protein BG653_00835 [Streptomyces platensis]
MDRVTSTDPGPMPDPRALRPRLPSPVQEIEDAPFARRGVRLLLKRDDLIHPELPRSKPTGVSGPGLVT